MKITLDIPDNKYQFFLELVKNLTFVKVDDDDEAIPEWQMIEVNTRLENHKNNPDQAMDFDAAMDDIEKDL